ncbi:sigma-70 family RNA polymerase sigma factor [Reinekea marinisedimentorum]|uniref:RNA polymerase sigma-70 factor (ECF subfamily) n=1 Tax=Reinekea marinisedimentorum TaxID=230495 RepID=A0A4R3IB00_9GAMM|nr:sigma-70 family RNA polymerase sigma factor [Reinekea marinisedimentorum]TCS41617.1 RNA polymerase sigma-70 factor (ECF subfamily) [Reinekea marinisedimentorum]
MTLLSSAQNWWRKKQSKASAEQLSDEQLLLSFIAETNASFIEILMQRHNKALFHFLLSLSDAQTAEDIAQQTWLKLLENPERYNKQQAAFRTWLFTVGRNQLFDVLRQSARWQWQPIEETANDDLPAYNDELHFTEQENLQQRFNQALEALPFAQREAITLQLEGFSLEEIAAIIGEKPETIKSRLRFARKNLKQQLEPTA